MNVQSFAIELRTRAYPTEARCYCAKCAVFLDEGQPKNPNFKYLAREEFDKITDHLIDDSVLNVFTVDQILSLLLAIKDYDNTVKYFSDQKDRTGATVKFFGEILPTGPCDRWISPENQHVQITESLSQCNNPSCKLEIKLPRDYPFVEQTVGRMIRNPEELQHPDDVIKNVQKKHIGSTVRQNFKEEKTEQENKNETIKSEKRDNSATPRKKILKGGGSSSKKGKTSQKKS